MKSNGWSICRLPLPPAASPPFAPMADSGLYDDDYANMGDAYGYGSLDSSSQAGSQTTAGSGSGSAADAAGSSSAGFVTNDDFGAGDSNDTYSNTTDDGNATSSSLDDGGNGTTYGSDDGYYVPVGNDSSVANDDYTQANDTLNDDLAYYGAAEGCEWRMERGVRAAFDRER